jgi:hypothetical protein
MSATQRMGHDNIHLTYNINRSIFKRGVGFEHIGMVRKCVSFDQIELEELDFITKWAA